MRRPLSLLFCSFVLSLASNAFAQVVNPATAQQKPESDQSTSGKLHTWEMPPITVEGKAPLFEEDLIGDYASRVGRRIAASARRAST